MEQNLFTYIFQSTTCAIINIYSISIDSASDSKGSYRQRQKSVYNNALWFDSRGWEWD